MASGRARKGGGECQVVMEGGEWRRRRRKQHPSVKVGEGESPEFLSKANFKGGGGLQSMLRPRMGVKEGGAGRWLGRASFKT